MKKLFVTIVAVCFTAICMTGCLGDDTNSSSIHQMTNNEKAVVMNAMVGSYSGYVKYYKTTSTVDSITTSWTIKSDSTMSVNYPVKLITAYMDSTSQAEAYKAIVDAPAQTLDLRIYIPTVVSSDYYENYQKGYYETTLVPITTTQEFSIGEHKYAINYSASYVAVGYYSVYYPLLDYYQSQVQGYILINTITVDGKTISVSLPTMIFGKK